MNKSLFLLALTFSLKAFSSFDYVRPIPYKPKSLDPSLAVDVVSYSLIPQIHKSLFSFDSRNYPKPDLVNEFEVSNNGKKYLLSLKSLTFSNGKTVTPQKVKESIERAIKKRIIDFSKFRIIEGVNSFLNGVTKVIKGIRVNSKENTIQFTLRRPNPSFLYYLADPRLAIIDEDGSGLGTYKISQNIKDKIILEQVSKSKNLKIPNKIKFVVKTRDAAIKEFSLGLLDDLALYSIKKSEIRNLKNHSTVSIFQYPKTYAVFLNSGRVKKQIREKILKSVDWKKIVRTCFDEEHTSLSIIPPGFIGYQDITPPDRNEKSCTGYKLKMAIPVGLGQEKCLAREINNQCRNIKTKIIKFNEVVEGWQSNKLDSYFGYVEAENSIDFFGHFTSDAIFPLGLKKDKVLDDLVIRLNQENEIEKKDQIAKMISNHLFDIKTTIPMFYEKQYLVLNKKYKEIKMGIKSASMIPIEKIERKE